jgi:DNA-binding response OmpR family regulator
VIADLAGKRVLVLSDNEGLFKAIELALSNGHLEVVSFALSFTRQWKSEVEKAGFDLIVLAVSSLNSEPVVDVVLAALAEQIGQVPLLIISDDPSRSDSENQIFHLDFPFDIHTLYDKVDEILQLND